jgi:hypothetical protein
MNHRWKKPKSVWQRRRERNEQIGNLGAIMLVVFLGLAALVKIVGWIIGIIG